jgi:hypothetical protein
MNRLQAIVRLAAGLCTVIVGSAQAQERALREATLAGVVRDSATGLPIVWMDIILSRYISDRTDWQGAYSLRGIPPGVHQLRLFCPSSTWNVQLHSTVEVEVREPETRRDLWISRSRCTEPRFISLTGEFEGLHRYGFELNVFVPCPGSLRDPEWSKQLKGGLSKRLIGQSISLDLTDSAHARYMARRGRPIYGWNEPWVYVRVRGALEGPGKYGHMGISTYAVQVKEILEFSEPPPACPASSGEDETWARRKNP